MGNLVIVLLLVCMVSSCMARSRFNPYPDGVLPIKYRYPYPGASRECEPSEDHGKPCRNIGDCCLDLVCKNGICQGKPCQSDHQCLYDAVCQSGSCQIP
uniref:Putative conserved secreted protein n=1 Tax=Ixodes ricinus TaxID=34613 RepID=A0A147BX21_IXORI